MSVYGKHKDCFIVVSIMPRLAKTNQNAGLTYFWKKRERIWDCATTAHNLSVSFFFFSSDSKVFLKPVF